MIVLGMLCGGLIFGIVILTFFVGDVVAKLNKPGRPIGTGILVGVVCLVGIALLAGLHAIMAQK